MTLKKAEVEHIELDEKTLRYIEEVGSYYDRYGGLRTAGRIIGLLLLAEKPLNADEIAHTLKISRSGVSTNLQILQAARQIQIAPRRLRGERREYFEIAPGSWERLFLDVDERIKGLLGIALSGLKSISPENEVGLLRLNHLRELIEFYQHWFDGFETAWLAHKANQPIAANQPEESKSRRNGKDDKEAKETKSGKKGAKEKVNNNG